MSSLSLPDFNENGDLPVGLHQTSLEKAVQRFGAGSEARRTATEVLLRIHGLASKTGRLERFIVFGSYVTAKLAPNDVDVVLVMASDFSPSECIEEVRVLFDHQRADNELGASVFWLTPSSLLTTSLDDFLLGWGTKRDMSRRGIVEVIS